MMDSNLDRQLELLTARNKTCILLNKDTILFEAFGLGVKPLRELRRLKLEKQPGDHWILIDRVIGKGALMLAELIGVDVIYTPLTSQAALDYAKEAGIPVHFSEVVSFIENRDRSGMCPIENSVKDTNNPHLGEQNIEAAIKILMR